MADEILRSRHAFGNLANVAAALEANKIDEHDILFLDGDTNPKIGWIDKNKNVRLVDNECVIVIEGQSLPASGQEGKVYIFNNEGYFWNGTEFVNFCKPTDLTKVEADLLAKIEQAVKDANAYADEKDEAVKVYADEKVKDALSKVEHLYDKVKYEITNTPVGTVVDYFEKEIRVMCPENAVFTKQTVGATGNANMYYMGFKAYAPEGAVSFKEGDKGVIVDEMFTFDNDFAGTDEYGRNYSIVWFALASCGEDGTWTYFGKNSSFNKYLGWTYCVEWYNADGVMMASDIIRINLSNESCHNDVRPYYLAEIAKEIEEKIDERITEVEAAYEVVEF